MSVMEALQKRHAYRAFDEKKIDRSVIERIITAASLAPSAMNSQPWRFIAVDENPTLDALKETLTGGNYWGKKAPLIIALVTNPAWSLQYGGRDFAFFELGMSAMALQLQSVEEGLYIHPIAGFDADKAKKVLAIPAEDTLETLLIVGYKGDESSLNEKHRSIEHAERKRKPLSDILTYNV